jgi:hypothetical protein
MPFMGGCLAGIARRVPSLRLDPKEAPMNYSRRVDHHRTTVVACALVLAAGCGSPGGDAIGTGTGGGQQAQGGTSGTVGGSAGKASTPTNGGTSVATTATPTTGGTGGVTTTTPTSGGTGGVTTAATGAGATALNGSGGTTSVRGGTGGVTTATTGIGGTGLTGSGGTSARGGTTSTVGQGGRSAAGAGGGRSGGAGQAGASTSQGGLANSGGSGGQTGGTAGAGLVGSCVGNAWPTADPTVAGPFAVTADKNVGPLAGVVPDPVYGNTQQRFNVYRPTDLAKGGYCHPILVWANGHTDNPEPNPPLCVTGGGQYCGSYLMLMNQLASHGFVVIASLSTITSQGNPLPTIVGLDWLIQQQDDSTSPYYHRLDTAHVGALGHSEGGFSTSKAASDPRISAIATVSGAAANAGIHGPSLWFCGGNDTVVSCDSVSKVYASITNQPAMLVDNLASDHGGWLYQNGAKGPDIFGFTAWFRVHLMGDTANRKMFYGSTCTLCTDSRVQVQQNSLMTP